jgi:hypothetical protein
MGNAGDRPTLNGKATGCYGCSNTNPYYFYTVVYAQ